MPSTLPGKSSPNTIVALTKVALRIVQLPGLADAIGDLTGLGQTSIESLVRAACQEIANRSSAEFADVDSADREAVEGVLERSYKGLAADPSSRIMGESLIGTAAVVRLANEALTAADRRVIEGVSDDAKAYFDRVSESIAYLISKWYATNAEANRGAMSQATGETLQAVRAIPDQVKANLDSFIAVELAQLKQAALEGPGSPPEPKPELIVFELDLHFAPLATDARLAELVSAAVVAVLEGRPVRIEVSLPTLDESLKNQFDDAVLVAQLKSSTQKKAQRLQLVLSAFFSPQVETQWAFYLQGVPARVTVVRAILAEQETAGSKLDIWRTGSPYVSTSIRLTLDEVHAVLESVGLTHWEHLSLGAGWRAAHELPRSVIVEKVMSSILTALVREEVTSEDDWTADLLTLYSWHIGSD